MKLFLTGKKQVGKSTAIQCFLKESGLRPGGFFTSFEETEDKRILHMSSMGEELKIAVAIGDFHSMQALPGAFYHAAKDLLSNRGDLLVMDELGYLEKDDEMFREAVVRALDEKGPLLGVLREGFPGWTAEIAARADVEIITVTEENRDEIPLAIKSRFLNIGLSAVVMAAGRSLRFGSNKLTAPVEGLPMIERLFQNLPATLLQKIVVVARDTQVLKLAEHYGFATVLNDDLENDPALTIRLGMETVEKDSKGCLFLVGDQPWLSKKTILRLGDSFLKKPGYIHVPVNREGKRGNPVFFPEKVFCELKKLPPYHRGKTVIGSHPEIVIEQEVESLELSDVDYSSDLKCSANNDCAL